MTIGGHGGMANSQNVERQSSTSENLDGALQPSALASVAITLDTLGSSGSLTANAACHQSLLSSVRTEDVIKSLIDFIASKKSLPMWNYEDITSRVWSIRSAEQLETFLCFVLSVFKDSLPQAHIEERWAQIALQLALSCSSRHYAGRSLQACAVKNIGL